MDCGALFWGEVRGRLVLMNLLRTLISVRSTLNRLLELRPAKVQCFQASVAKWRTNGDAFGCAQSTNPSCAREFLKKYQSMHSPWLTRLR